MIKVDGMDISHLIALDTINIDLQANSKTEVLKELVDMLHAAGKLNNSDKFLADVWQREQIGNTGFDDGIALPHAKSAAVTSPAIAIGVSRKGIDYGAENDELSHLFILLASPDGDDFQHIEVLAKLSEKLVQSEVVEQLKLANNSFEVVDILACKSNGSKKESSSLSDEIVMGSGNLKSVFKRLQQHLLFGTSHMIPFIISGGVLMSLSVMLAGQGSLPENGLLADIAQMGIAGLSLFMVVLGGFIAYSIADKPALAPAMIGSWIAVNHYNTGFLGVIAVGFFAGSVVELLKRIYLPESLTSLGAIFLYPIVGTFLTCGLVMWGIGEPIALAMQFMNTILSDMAGSSKVMLGAVLGAMTAFDLGGPINKVATLFAQTQVDTQPWLMGGVGIAICTPPLGMALATLIRPNKFRRNEREAGKAAGIMGFLGISEGAIPFAISDPARVLPAVVAGGVIGNITGFLFQVANHAPWGGWIVLPIVDGKLGYVMGTILGSITTAVIVIALKKNVIEQRECTEYVPNNNKVAEGHAKVIAVTACPSGVAHTFLAAKSLEQAAKAVGVTIKIETQGANGTTNRLSQLDIENASFIILAHDVAIKEPERFHSIPIRDVSTKQAIHHPIPLVKGLID